MRCNSPLESPTDSPVPQQFNNKFTVNKDHLSTFLMNTNLTIHDFMYNWHKAPKPVSVLVA